MKKFLLMIVAIFVAVAVSAQTNKKVIYLKNGTVVRGVVIDQVPGQSIKVRTADGSIFKYTMAEIKSMERDEILDDISIEKKKSGLKKGFKYYIDLSVGKSTPDDCWEGGLGLGPSVSVGYLFSPYFYVGLGGAFYRTSADYEYDEFDVDIFPIFVDIKGYLNKRKVTPFISLRAGQNVGIGEGFYISPSVGIRYRINKKMGINMGVEYIQSGCEPYDDLEGDSSLNAINFKLGIDF